MGSYYKKSVLGQMQGVMTRPTSGLNEYNSSLEINDNILSKCLDIYPQKNETLKFQKTTANVNYATPITGTGRVVYSIADKIPTDATNLTFKDHVVGVLFNNTPSVDHYLDYLIDINVTDESSSTIDISSHNLLYEYPQSMCLYFTETSRYVAYTNSSVKKLFIYNYTSLEVIDLWFNPKKIVAHTNRIFVMDTTNKIWWCRAGDFRTWYGMAVDDDYITVLVDMANSAYTLAHQPPVPMFLSFTVVKTSTIDTLGTIALVGKSPTNVDQSETVIPIDGVVYSKYAYKSITSATSSGWSGVAGTDKIKIGVTTVANGIAQDDAGYWTFENERILNGIAKLGSNLYIWSDTNIYVFSGYSYDTFSSVKLISDIGANNAAGATVSYDLIAVSNNRAYFYYSGDLYEFNGSDYPKIISRPVTIHGQNSNGVSCGIIPESDSNLWALACDKDYLYYYDTYHIVGSGETADDYIYLYYYKFDIQTRTWWKYTGFSIARTASTDIIEAFYIPQPDRSGMYAMYASTISTVKVYRLTTNMGLNIETMPYLVTKAFNTKPSETGTLTSIIIMFKGSLASITADFKVYYSLTESDDDFVELWSYDGYDFNGDVETIDIPCLQSAIARAHHYRLKIEIEPSVDASYIYLYNIERRYRVMGRSR